MGYAVFARRLRALSRPRSVHFSLDRVRASGIVGVIHKAAPSGPIRLDGERVGLSNKAALVFFKKSLVF